jgi:SAM-dependent methyltransferase
MHATVRKEFKAILKAKYIDRTVERVVVEVGSYNVNGNVDGLLPTTWKKIGIDLRSGPGVDVVVEPLSYPFADNSVGVVLCFNTLHYAPNPFATVKEMARILEPGGVIYLVAPHVWPTNSRHTGPAEDCFRYLPAGMISIFEEAGIAPIRAYLNERDCWGIGRKK